MVAVKRGSLLLAVGVLMCVPLVNLSADEASWAGLTLTDPTEAQLDAIEAAYGEPAGLAVTAIAPDSMASVTGLKPGDFLISVRMPDETDWYPIPDLEEMAAWIPDNAPADTMRLLVLREVAGTWYTLKGYIGKPFGVQVDEGVSAAPAATTGPTAPTAEGAQIPEMTFLSDAPEQILATAPDGAQLSQRDVDIYSGIIAWCFGTRLTEAQKEIVKQAIIGFWQQAPPGGTQSFNDGVRPMPDLLPRLSDQEREQMRGQMSATLIQMAYGMQTLPLGQVILQVASNAQQVLAGAGTQWPLTQQDVDSTIEYSIFQTQMMTGQPVYLSDQQRMELAMQIVQQYNAGSAEEQEMLSRMDEYWASARVLWSMAAAAQQEAAQQQWLQAYQQQYQQAIPMSAGGWDAAYPVTGYPTGGGEMSDSTFNTLKNVLEMDHQSSMSAIGAIDGAYDYDVYDAGGNWLYSY